MKGKRLSVMLIFSAVMIALVIFSELFHAHKIQEENQRYWEEHSLFEDIAVGGRLQQGTMALGPSLEETLAEEDDSPDSDSPMSTDANSAARAKWEEERTAQAPAARQETFLSETEDGRWALYAAGDFSDRPYVYFEKFQALKLTPVSQSGRELAADAEKDTEKADAEKIIDPEKDTEKTSADGFTLQSGDILPQTCMENGSVWHAQILGKNEKILEEGELVIYCGGETATLYINTESGSLDALNADRSVRENCRYLICRPDGSRDSSGSGEIHGRGNSSWKEDKKQYSLNLSSDTSILGMESSRKFALIANTSDPSFLRNKITCDLAALTGMPASPQTAYVNVYFNGFYHGLYLMAQRPNAKGGSVHIARLEEKNRAAAGTGTDGQEQAEDFKKVTIVDDDGLEIHASSQERIPDNISGGYLLEMDARYEDEDYWFSTNRHHFVVKYPEAVPVKECQYIAAYLREAETALYSRDGINPDTGKSWDQYFDTDSWAAMYLMQDFMAQWDVESFSFFVFKDADDPLLYCGPVWDFDLSMGATGIGKLPNVMRQSIWLRDHREGWLTELEKFPSFTAALETLAGDRFFPLLEEYLREDSSLSVPGAEEYRRTLGPSVTMDAARWGGSDHFEAESEKLLSWLQDRADFWQGIRDNPSAYCKVTLRYGFNDMDIYLPRGEEIGFVPTEEYGEHLYSSFREKYGSIDGWLCEDGSLLTPQTVIGRDQVMIPFSRDGGSDTP